MLLLVILKYLLVLNMNKNLACTRNLKRILLVEANAFWVNVFTLK
jgi:hypothetical protein